MSSVSTRPKERKSHDRREKELLLAVAKIKRDHGGKFVTFASVARAAGVSTALIHNYFPTVSLAIGQASGRSSERRRSDQSAKLAATEEGLRSLRADNRKLREQVRHLASINENLLAQLRKARAVTGKILRVK